MEENTCFASELSIKWSCCAYAKDW